MVDIIGLLSLIVIIIILFKYGFDPEFGNEFIILCVILIPTICCFWTCRYTADVDNINAAESLFKAAEHLDESGKTEKAKDAFQNCFAHIAKVDNGIIIPLLLEIEFFLSEKNEYQLFYEECLLFLRERGVHSEDFLSEENTSPPSGEDP